MPPELYLATARGNTYKKFGEVQPCGFRDMRTERQRDSQTRTQLYSSQYFAPLPIEVHASTAIRLNSTRAVSS